MIRKSITITSIIFLIGTAFETQARVIKTLNQSFEQSLSADTSKSSQNKQLIADANKLLTQKPFTVMSKEGIPPSGNKHDYLSLAPYFWPDPSKKDGLPYIRKDGQVNPQTRTNFTDYNELNSFFGAVSTLRKAYEITQKQVYLERAKLFIKVWFIDKETKMNPNLNFGQGIRGVNDGRQFGIIEFGGIASVLDAMKLLEDKKIADPEFENDFKTWLRAYADWLQNSKLGKLEAGTSNNHGTTYDLQLSNILAYLNDETSLKKMLESVKTRRIDAQIESDGKQPEELARTKAFSYSLTNLNGLTGLAVLAKNHGIDLWDYQNPKGGSIKKAYEFLIPYLEKKWEYEQITSVDDSRKRLVEMLSMAGKEFNEPSFISIANQYK